MVARASRGLQRWLAGVTTFDGRDGVAAVKASL